MSGIWQDLVALGLAGLSLLYLVRGAWRLWHPRTSGTIGCSGLCAGCGDRSAAPDTAAQIVRIGAPPSRSRS